MKRQIIIDNSIMRKLYEFKPYRRVSCKNEVGRKQRQFKNAVLKRFILQATQSLIKWSKMSEQEITSDWPL